MAQRIPTKFVAMSAALACLAGWWLLSGSEPVENVDGSSSALVFQNTGFVSSIKPISDAQASTDVGTLAGSISDRSPLQAKATPQDQHRFAQINALIEQGQQTQAIEQLNEFIDEKPTLVEPYINLAGLYVDAQQLDLARQTLLKGINANQQTAILFDSLKQVHGAQAALAYQRALNVESKKAVELALPLLQELTGPMVSTVVQSQQNNAYEQALLAKTELESALDKTQQDKASLEKSLQDTQVKLGQLAEQEKGLQQRATALQNDNTTLQTRLSELNASNQQLRSENTELGQSQRESEQRAKRLQAAYNDLEKQNQQSIIAQQNAQQLDADAKDSKIVSLEQRLKETQSQIDALNRTHKSELAQLQQQLSEAQTLAANAQQAAIVATRTAANTNKTVAAVQNNPSESEQDKTLAIKLVKSWASSWSAQDVPAYVAHYADAYIPVGSSMTHQQWLDQRQIRLTNKAFINVEVSDFDVTDRGSQFSVTFFQHYRSNTVDDRIKKQLVFAKSGDGNWSQAKIVAERVLTP